MGLWMLSSVNRFRNDFKIGVQGFKYVPLLKFVYDLGNDNYKLNGIFFIPCLNIAGYGVYYGISSIPLYWRNLNWNIDF